MAEADWYEVVEGDVVSQGDVLFHFPVAVPGELPWPVPDGYKPPVDVSVYDLIVLTQSCDLVNDKVDEVLLTQVIAWDKVVGGAPKDSHYRSSKFRAVLVDGNVPGLHLLHRTPQGPTLPWSVVNFHRLFSVPKAFVRKFAEEAGLRLRLRPPYREHLSQAFARYFMRVGLPLEAKSFLEEGKPPS